MARNDRRMTTRNSLTRRTAQIAFVAAFAALPLGSAVAEASIEPGSVETERMPAIAVPVVQEIPPAQPAEVEAAQPAPVQASRSLGSGVASFYGSELHGRRTASGERFDMNALTAAHRTLPFGTRLLVTNPSNGRTVTVRVNDRGPFHGGRVIDLSHAAATQIGLVARGHGRVELAVVDS